MSDIFDLNVPTIQNIKKIVVSDNSLLSNTCVYKPSDKHLSCDHECNNQMKNNLCPKI